MTVMGERLPEAWMVEWHRNRRVEFPLRRRWMLRPPMVLWLPLALAGGGRITDMLGDGGWRFLGYLLIAMYAGIVVGITWQLVTQRPVLVVDRRGIHLGRRSIPWTDVGSIGIIQGPKPIRQLPIHPKNVWAKDLVLTQQHVNDLQTFQAWLDELLNEHRQTFLSA